jgi:hypothetical protein
MSFWHYLGLAAGLTVGNYTYQLHHGADWKVAFERSFFQVTAVAQ